jgi:hypothetical protein
MSVNTAESENAQPVAHKPTSELIYRLEDRPPLPQTLFAAFQHLLAMFVAVITPALLICQALGLPAQDTQHIISMSLFASGVASIIQIKAWGPVGSGLLSIQGTSFNFVAPLIMGGTALKTGGADVPTMMAALFGTLMLASCTEMVLSRVLHLARRIITPLVSGVVVMIIGLSLIQVGLTSIGGGYAAMADHTFGAPKNLLLAGIVLALIIIQPPAQPVPAHRFAGDRHGGRLSGGVVPRYAAGQHRPDQQQPHHRPDAALLWPRHRLEPAAAADAGVYDHLAGNHRRYHRHLRRLRTAGLRSAVYEAPERRRAG